LALVARALDQGTLVKLTLAKPRGPDADLLQVSARRLTLRGQACLSFVHRYKTRDVTRNLSDSEGLALVGQLLGQAFANAHLLTLTQDAHLVLSRRGQATLRLGPAALLPAPAMEHDRGKRRLVDIESPFLVELGVTDREHRLIPALARKWKQINKFVEIFAHAFATSGLVQRDATAVAEVLEAWAGDDEPADDSALQGDIDAFVDQYHGVPLAQLSLADMLGDVTAILRAHRLALPADLALLIKTFVTLEGMGRALDPDFHMAAEALPLLRQALHERYQPGALAERGWASLRRTAALIGRLPRDLARLLRTARRGRIQLQIDVADLHPVVDQLDRAAQRIAVGLVVAALIIGSSIVMTVGGGPTLFGLPAFGLLGFVGATLGAIWLVLGGRPKR